ncbi:ribonuclease E/G [Halovulum sp. GXIMD14793]
MKGRVVAIDTLDDGRNIAALIVDGRLHDLLVDPPESFGPVRPGAIFRARLDRPMKGQGGAILDLGNGHKGFLRAAKGISPGTQLTVQVSTVAEPPKATPATPDLLHKSRYAIITPGKPGHNISRAIRDEDERDRLAEIAHEVMQGADTAFGLILRSAAEGVEAETIAGDISAMLEIAQTVARESSPPGLLIEAPDAGRLAWREWAVPDPDEVRIAKGAFDDFGLWEQIDDLFQPHVLLPGGGSLYLEPTRALIAVDVNTGRDTSAGAGLKTNIAALRETLRQLRLRGLGGQVVIDPAPVTKRDRQVVEQTLRAAIRADSIETSLAGWTPLGHMELQRKREKYVLAEVLRR